MAIRIPLGLCVVLLRRKGERIPTSGFALPRRRLCRIVPLGGMTEGDRGRNGDFNTKRTQKLIFALTIPPKDYLFNTHLYRGGGIFRA